MRVAPAISALALALVAVLFATVAPTWWGTVMLATIALTFCVVTYIKVQRLWPRTAAIVGGLLSVWVLANAGLTARNW